MNEHQSQGGPPVRVSTCVAALLGFAGGASALIEGFYDIEAWAVVGLAVLGALMVAIVAASTAPGRLALLAPASLAALAGWQYLSRGWAESTSQAVVEGQRTAVLAALLGLLLMVTPRRRDQVVLLGAVGAGALCAAAVEFVRLFGDPVPDDFIGGRLADPLGYMNGQAAALLAGFWPAVALAEHARSWLARAAGTGAAALVLGMSLMTQSRAGLAALVVSAVVVVAVVPGRGRRLGILGSAALAVLVASGALQEVYASGNERAALPEQAVLREGLLTLLGCCLVAAAAWASVDRPLTAALGRLRPPAGVVRAAPWAAAGLAALALIAVAAPGARFVDRQVDAFTELQPVTGSSRFASVGGNRYDYWRVAARQFRDQPARGIGAGNFDTTYFRDRRTPEDVRQPHSIWLQALAETGLVGFFLLLLFAFAVLVSAARALRLARYGGQDRALFVAAAGGFTLWLAHTSVDWMHLLPGVTLCALAAAAVLLRAGDRARSSQERSPMPGRAVAFAAATLAAAAVAAGLLAAREREAAERALADGDAPAALRSAADSLRLDPEALPTLYAAAAAYARLGRYEDARATLERARSLEPSDFVPPALLGDLATRRGDHELALRDYRTALELNPLDPGLAASVRAASDRIAPPP